MARPGGRFVTAAAEKISKSRALSSAAALLVASASTPAL